MKRNFGLDVFRAIAILLVLANHSWYFFSQGGDVLSVAGVMGVELFFVLSGFLIGQIVLRDFKEGINADKVIKFYIRRWFRTLPLYYMILIALVCMDSILHHQLNLHPFHFIFLQNFFQREVDFFGVSWSLSVEEWFYFLLPLLLSIFFSKIKNGKGILILVSLTILAIVGLRILVVGNVFLAYETVRRNIPLRFDSLLIGVVLAIMKVYYQPIYNKLKSTIVTAVSSFGLLCMVLYYSFVYLNKTIDHSFFLKTVGFLLISLFVAGIMPFFENSDFINDTWRSNKYVFTIFTTLSAISYPLYLTHQQIFSILLTMSRMPALLSFTVALFTALSLAYVLHVFYEKPIMQLRDRLTHGNLTFWKNLPNFIRISVKE